MLHHSPAEIVTAYLTQTDSAGTTLYFSDLTLGVLWPLYTDSMPGGPQDPINCGCIYDTSGEYKGRTNDGAVLWKWGLQLRTRSEKYVDGWNKIFQTQQHIATVLNVQVAIDSPYIYLINTFVPTSPIFSLGVEPGTTRRWHLFTVNFLVFLKEINDG